MKSNPVYAHQAKKNFAHHTEDKQPTSVLNVNNFSSNRYEKTKILDDKSIQKMTQNDIKFDKKPKQKNEVSFRLSQLKMQLNIIMHDAKMRKAYSPSSMEQKFPEEFSLENKNNQRTESPLQTNKKPNHPIKLRQDVQEKKKSAIPVEMEKKSPTWLSKKGKNEGNFGTNKKSLTKLETKKNSQNRAEISPSNFQMKEYHQFGLKQQNRKEKEFQFEDLKVKKSLSNFGKEWKKCICEEKPLKTIEEEFKTQPEQNENFEIKKIYLEKQINQLKFQLQITLEDKNILINRIQTLEMELALAHKKTQEWKQLQIVYRSNEKNLKETIAELEDKLITSRQSKNKHVAPDIGKFYGDTLSDRQIFQKKNEEISRLSQIIKNNRNKVTEVNKDLNQERIKFRRMIQSMEQKNKVLAQQKDAQIGKLKYEIHKSKEEIVKLHKEIEGMRTIKESFLHHLHKQQQSTNFHSFVEKTIGEDNYNARSTQSPKETKDPTTFHQTHI